MLFFDFEVFQYNWCVVIIDTTERATTTIWDDPSALTKFYQKHVQDIWAGYNVRHYDQYVLQAIVCGFNAKDMSDWIILDEQPGWKFSSILKSVPIISFDVMDIGEKSLKYVEGSLGHSIVESSVDFNIDRPLTEDEKVETTRYCTTDVEETVRVFLLGQSEYHARMGLIEKFHRPLADLGKTKTQQSTLILRESTTDHVYKPHYIEEQPQPPQQPIPAGVRTDFSVVMPPTLVTTKYAHVRDWFMNPANWHYKDGKRTHSLDVMFGDLPMSFSWGGGHGALKRYHSKGYYLNVDVKSLYPSLMLTYPDICGLGNVFGMQSLSTYEDILLTRLALKAAGKKAEQAPLKIVLNGTYGGLRQISDQYGLNVCILGQMLVCVDLLEQLEPLGDIMQANTDGTLIRKRDDDPTSPEDWFAAVDDACYAWEKRTGLDLDFDWYGYGELWQKDVSNYLIKSEDGHYKAKGAWLREPSKFDRNIEVVRRAIIDFFTDGVRPEDTINECTSLMDFQYVAKISGKYTCLAYGNPTDPNSNSQTLRERCIRWFASKNAHNPTYYKKKTETGRWARLESTPDHCRAINTDIRDVPIPDWVDKQWYIDLAVKRIRAFGVDI